MADDKVTLQHPARGTVHVSPKRADVLLARGYKKVEAHKPKPSRQRKPADTTTED